MHCDRCENEATVHEVTIHKGQVLEVHLCESCAQEAGIVAGSPVPVAELIEKIASGAGKASTPEAVVQRCDVCGTTFTQFKQSGRLGCPECYKALERQLGPILDRAHQGAVHHVGKVPRRMVRDGDTGTPAAREAALAAAEARAEQIRRLRAELSSAVRGEQYERAAKIRDRLRQLQGGSETAEGAGEQL